MPLRIYAIDNSQNTYSSGYQISYVEADPAVMEPLLAALWKAWPRSSHRYTCRVIFTADRLDWRTGGPKAIGEWITRLSLSQYVSDTAAAEEFRQLALAVKLEPGFRQWLTGLNFQLGEQ
jgi:hypothetical protein